MEEKLTIDGDKFPSHGIDGDLEEEEGTPTTSEFSLISLAPE